MFTVEARKRRPRRCTEALRLTCLTGVNRPVSRQALHLLVYMRRLSYGKRCGVLQLAHQQPHRKGTRLIAGRTAVPFFSAQRRSYAPALIPPVQPYKAFHIRPCRRLCLVLRSSSHSRPLSSPACSVTGFWLSPLPYGALWVPGEWDTLHP